jgi:diguanylate cyclase (GGDEF)-like protein
MSTPDYVAPERILSPVDRSLATWGIDWTYSDPMGAIAATDAWFARPEPSRAPFENAAAHFIAGTAYAVTGELNTAQTHLDAAETIYSELGNDLGVAYVILRRDLVWHQIEDTDIPIEQFPEALSIARRYADDWLEAGIHNDLGLIDLRKGEFAGGIESLFNALAVAERGGDRLQEFVIRLNLATAFMELHDYEVAHTWCLQCIEADGFARPAELRFDALHRLAVCKEQMGDSVEALRLMRESTTLAETLDFTYGVAEGSYDAGILLYRLDDLAGAADSFRHSIGRFQQVETPISAARIPMCHWWLERIDGNYTLATYRALSQIADSGIVGAYERAFDLHDALARSAEALDMPSQAIAHLRQSRTLAETYWGDIGRRQTRVALKRHQLAAAEREADRERKHREELARALAASQALNAENQHLLERLQEQSIVLEQQASEDALTGIGNRRYFDAQLEQMIQRTDDRRTPTALALADIDNFKEINDRNSHRVGDEVLITVSGILRAVLRQSHVFARYGGEEFAFLFTEITHERAVAITESIRAAVETYPWESLAKGLSVTLSVGLASDTSGTPADQLLATADALLYRAKHSGKNRVEHRVVTEQPRLSSALPSLSPSELPAATQ